MDKYLRSYSFIVLTGANTDGIFNRFVTVFANRARHVSGELSLGRETETI
jgi:hypothetical protein